MFAILAQTTGPSTRPFWAEFFASPLFLMVLLLLVMFVFMNQSKRKQEKQRRDMLGALKKGDRIQTIGGILGTVLEVRESEVVLKVDESSNTKMRFARSAIHQVLEEEKGK
jgi:preprotein translocase subunit YajC